MPTHVESWNGKRHHCVCLGEGEGSCIRRGLVAHRERDRAQTNAAARRLEGNGRARRHRCRRRQQRAHLAAHGAEQVAGELVVADHAPHAARLFRRAEVWDFVHLDQQGVRVPCFVVCFLGLVFAASETDTFATTNKAHSKQKNTLSLSLTSWPREKSRGKSCPPPSRGRRWPGGGRGCRHLFLVLCVRV